MLRRIIKHTGLIDDIGKMLRVTRWKTIVTSGLDVQQLIQRIAVRQPGGSFLVRAEQVAFRIEGHAHGKSNSGANDLAVFKIGRDLHNRAAFAS